MSAIIYARDAGILPGSASYVQNAVNALLQTHNKDCTIVFDAGEYHLRPSRQMALSQSNSTPVPSHDVGLVMEQCDNVTLDFSGSVLYCSGQMLPLALLTCRHVTVQNVTLDWQKPLFAEGIVTACGTGFIDLFINPILYPHRFEDHWLTFDCGNGEWYALNRWTDIQFTPDTKVVVPGSGDNFSPTAIDDLGENVYRFYAPHCDATVGNIFVLRVAQRINAGIFLEDCVDTMLRGVTIYCTGGLGILAQFCDTLTYDHVTFAPNAETGRKIANGHDDGLHITCCRGTVTVEHCSFAGLMDDPINVHTCSVTADKMIDERTVLCRYRHPAAQNFLYWARPGDNAVWLDRAHMNQLAVGNVTAYRLLTPDTFALTFDVPVPADIAARVNADSEALALDNLSNHADFYCRRNVFGSGRARGLLVTTQGHVEITDNVFSSSGSAILLSGDANGWFETGACRDVTIKNNVFTADCFTSDYEFCRGVISLCPVIPKPDASLPYHQNVCITGNVFQTKNGPLLYALCTRGLTFTDNVIPSDVHEPVVTEYCSDTQLK